MQTKPGRHGTLYAYRITYTCDVDPVGFGTDTVTSWAYDREHAIDKFEESSHNVEQGWKLVKVDLID